MPPGRTSMIAGACNVMFNPFGPDNIYEKIRPESPIWADAMRLYSITAIFYRPQ